MAIIKVDYGEVGGGANIESGTMNFDSSGTQVTIPVSFTPSILVVMASITSDRYVMVYNKNVSSNQFLSATGGVVGTWSALGSGSACVIDSISPSVKVHWTNNATFYWVAIE